jgi:hypothetical protein
MRDPIVVGLVAIGLFANAPVSVAVRRVAPFDEANSYAAAGDVAAMKWLEAQPPGVVLSFPSSGALLPWLSGKKVYIGHWFMTLDFATKQREVQAFFAPSVPQAAKAEFLRRTGTRYVYFGAAESQAGTIDPTLPLERVYEGQGVSIYRVVGTSPR